MSTHKTKEQALRDLGEIVAAEVAIIRTLTVHEAAERIWYPGGPSMEECIRRAEASGLCKPDPVDPPTAAPRSHSAAPTQLDRIEHLLEHLASSGKQRVYSTRAAADYCGMSYGTFRNRLAAKTGPAQHKDGDSNGFFEADLDAWNETRLRPIGPP
jgi:predicted DNA-binding transcriptional regulator AlpA